MALKRKITKAEYEKLSSELKLEYVSSGDNYVLEISGDDDTGALLRAKDREVQQRKDAEEKAAKLQEELDGLQNNDAKKKGDIETLEKKWKADLEKVKTEAQAKIDNLTSHARKTLIDNKALELANKISTSPALILPHIKARLVADFEGDEPITKILGKDGKPSELKFEDLEKEFVENKDFSSIIRATKGSGSGAPNRINTPPGSAPNGDKPKQLSNLSPAEMVEHIKARQQS